MELVVIILTIMTIIIPTISTIAWVQYIQSEDAEFMASLKSMITEETTIEVPEIVFASVRSKYSRDYSTKLERETEADARMRQANLFYERGIVW